jgi:hypothetical protein
LRKNSKSEGRQSLLCLVCRQREATNLCPICGRSVCEEDFDPQLGVCVLCRDSLCAFCGKRLAVASCEVCGRTVCDECGVQVTPVVWLCPECSEKYYRSGEWPPADLVNREVEKLREILARLLSEPRRARQ